MAVDALLVSGYSGSLVWKGWGEMTKIRWKNHLPPSRPGGGWQRFVKDKGWQDVSEAEVRQLADTRLVLWEG
jgi:hypothetical protein